MQVKLQNYPSIMVMNFVFTIFSERHFSRLSRLLQQAMFVEYTWFCMKGVATDGYVYKNGVIENFLLFMNIIFLILTNLIAGAGLWKYCTGLAQPAAYKRLASRFLRAPCSWAGQVKIIFMVL